MTCSRGLTFHFISFQGREPRWGVCSAASLNTDCNPCARCQHALNTITLCQVRATRVCMCVRAAMCVCVCGRPLTWLRPRRPLQPPPHHLDAGQPSGAGVHAWCVVARLRAEVVDSGPRGLLTSLRKPLLGNVALSQLCANNALRLAYRLTEKLF